MNTAITMISTRMESVVSIGCILISLFRHSKGPILHRPGGAIMTARDPLPFTVIKYRLSEQHWTRPASYPKGPYASPLSSKRGMYCEMTGSNRLSRIALMMVAAMTTALISATRSRATLADRLDAARHRRFVGRTAERERFSAAVHAVDPPFARRSASVARERVAEIKAVVM